MQLDGPRREAGIRAWAGSGQLPAGAALAGLLLLGPAGVAARAAGAEPLRIEQPARISETLARARLRASPVRPVRRVGDLGVPVLVPERLPPARAVPDHERGPAASNGIVIGMIVLPDGTTRLIRNSRSASSGATSSRRRKYDCHCTPTASSVGQRRHRVQLRQKAGQFEIEAEATTPSVELGPVRYSRDDRYELALLAPRLRCQGFVQLPGEAAVTLGDGLGHRAALAVDALQPTPGAQRRRAAHLRPADAALDARLRGPARSRPAEHRLAARSAGRDARSRWCRASTGAGPTSHATRRRPTTSFPRALRVSSGPPPPSSCGRRSGRSTLRHPELDQLGDRPLLRGPRVASDPVPLRRRLRAARRRRAQDAALAGRGFALLSILNQPRAEWP